MSSIIVALSEAVRRDMNLSLEYFTLKEQFMITLERILCPTDLSEEAERTLGMQ